MPAKRRRRGAFKVESLSAKLSSSETVEIRFLQDPAACFRFFRDTILARAPESTFARHFGPGGINEGRAVLPDSYTLDRDAAVFRRFVDPWLRGHSGPSHDKWNSLEESERRNVAADLEFYGLDDIIPIIPETKVAAVKEPETVFGKRVVSFREALELLAGPSIFKLDNENNDGPFHFFFEPDFVIRSESSYTVSNKCSFTPKADDRVARSSPTEIRDRLSSVEVQCTVKTVFNMDPDEAAFWKRIEKGMWRYGAGSIRLTERCYRMGHNMSQHIFSALKTGVEIPEAGLSNQNLLCGGDWTNTGIVSDRVGYTIDRPFILVRGYDFYEAPADEKLNVWYLDEETTRKPRDHGLIQSFARDNWGAPGRVYELFGRQPLFYDDSDVEENAHADG